MMIVKGWGRLGGHKQMKRQNGKAQHGQRCEQSTTKEFEHGYNTRAMRLEKRNGLFPRSWNALVL